MTDYKVGDRPWYARFARYDNVRVPCPVCYGKREVRLILGNDDEVTLPCDYCGKGYNAPTGRVEEYQWTAEAQQVTITTVDITETPFGVDRRYHWYDGYWADAEDLFDTEDEANARAQEKAEAARLEEETRAEYIKKDVKKTFGWNAGYHLREAKKHREQIAYHERKAVLCKARAKDGSDG
jgi:hypothetical protein